MFEVGDRIICINPRPELDKLGTYTIKKIYNGIYQDLISLNELDEMIYGTYLIDRFVPDERVNKILKIKARICLK